MNHYYNENDPFKAEWLRRLIAQGHIPAGFVDTRSLLDLTPDDLAGYTQCHFFAGIGGWSLALRLAGWPEDRPCWTGSCPCQPFSTAGKGDGFADERHLWPYWFHLISVCRPPAVFGEQVGSGAAGAWCDLVQDDLEGLGYAFGACPLPASCIAAPHIRDRLWWVAHATGVRPERMPPVAGEDGGGDGRQGGGGPERRAAVQPAGGGADGRIPSYAEWFGVCWHPECRDGNRPGCDCHTRGAPEGWRWDDDDGWVADTHDAGQRAGGGAVRHKRDDLGRGGDAGLMAHPDWTGLEGREGIGRAGECAPRAGGVAGGVGDARCQRGELGRGIGDMGCPAGEEQGEAQERQRSRDAAPNPGPDGRPSPLHGFWRDTDWLLCRDGKWRPVEPGTFPLAHGLPNRVGRLRGYGDAIVPPLAAEFIKGYSSLTSIHHQPHFSPA